MQAYRFGRGSKVATRFVSMLRRDHRKAGGVQVYSRYLPLIGAFGEGASQQPEAGSLSVEVSSFLHLMLMLTKQVASWRLVDCTDDNQVVPFRGLP